MSKAFKFGMPSLIELNSLDENLQLCRELGLSFIELNMNLPIFQLPELYKLSSDPEIELTLHLPEKLNVWDFNDRVRLAYVETLKEVIAICEKLRIKIINMHMNKGIYFTLPDTKVYLFSKYKDVYLEHTRNFAKITSDMIGGTEIAICIENTGIYDNSFIAEAVDLLLSYSGFNLTWDIGHDFGSGQKDTAYVQANIDKLKHVHLHDAIGEQNHLTLGSGDIPAKKILMELQDKVERIVLETKTIVGLKKSITYLKKLGMRKE